MGRNYPNNTMVMEKYCSGSLDARYARWRCTKCKYTWERWIIGTTWLMMTGCGRGNFYLGTAMKINAEGVRRLVKSLASS